MSQVSTRQRNDGRRFRYDDLSGTKDVRLLKLDSRTSLDESLQKNITASFVRVPLLDLTDPAAYDYVAISYCWGDPKETGRLWVSDTEYIPVTASAASILRTMSQSRHKEKYGEYIWIDQICINQLDPEEKGQQVKLMFPIYHLASRVIAWLGGPEDDGDLAMVTLYDWDHALVVKDIFGRTPLFLPGDRYEYYGNRATGAKAHPLHHDPKVILSLAKFLDRPWFTRAWILQETIAAKHITIMIEGEHHFAIRETSCTNPRSMDWGKFVEFVKALEERFEHLLEVVRVQTEIPKGFESVSRIESLRNSRIQTKQRTPMQHNLTLTRKLEATDPRDKLFSIGSFSMEGDAEELQPDYVSPVRDIYTRATRYLIFRHQTLSLLDTAGIGWKRRLPQLPSWVPDYSQTSRTTSSRGTDVVIGNNVHKSGFAAGDLYSGGINASIASGSSSSSTSSVLQPTGILIDEVEIICSGLGPDCSLWGSLNSKHRADRQPIKDWFETVRARICTPDTDLSYLGNVRQNVKPFLWKHQSCSERVALITALVAGLRNDMPWRHDILDSDHFSIDDDLFGFLTFLAEMPDIEDGEIATLSDKSFASTTKRTIYSNSVVEDPRRDYSSTASWLQGPRSLLPTRKGVIDVTAMDSYLQNLEKFTNWCVFKTQSGYIGRGPPLMRPGDEVCVLKGSSTPFVVRKTKAPSMSLYNRWQLVGECYVQGLMHKEALGARVLPWRWGPITLV